MLIASAFCNDSPIIGILTLPNHSNLAYGSQLLQLESIKFLESTGGRVKDLQYDAPLQELTDSLDDLNGLFIPSYNDEQQQTRMSQKWIDALEALTKKALALNKDGTHFPVWISGTSAVSWFDQSSLEQIDQVNVKISPQFKQGFVDQNQIKFPDSSSWVNLRQALTSEKASSSKSTSLYTPLVTFSNENKEFVGLMKHPDHPIYVSFIQWEAVYNFYPLWTIPHDAASTRLAFSVSKFFTNECRKNDHAYSDIKTQYNNIIWRHHDPTVSKGVEEQRFYFNEY